MRSLARRRDRGQRVPHGRPRTADGEKVESSNSVEQEGAEGGLRRRRRDGGEDGDATGGVADFGREWIEEERQVGRRSAVVP